MTSNQSKTENVSEREVFSPIRWHDDGLQLLDQTLIPAEETWIDCQTPEIVADAIRRLAVRGAPAIGVAAAYGLVVGVTGSAQDRIESDFDQTYRLLLSTRPTAVNLAWALEQGRELFRGERAAGKDHLEIRSTLLEWAHRLHREDIAANRQIGKYGAPLFSSGDKVLTHCNAGGLATAGYGTAVGVITAGFDVGSIEQVWVDETRPLMQGTRLTSWELERLSIPYRIVTDSSVGALMSRGLVDRVVVGADRIAANGDAANKIGTYTVAVLAARHEVPFYVAAPRSTIDPHTATGDEIPIEERDPAELTELRGIRLAPNAGAACNFAFDVTPNELIAGIITEVGVLKAPYTESIAKALAHQED